MLVVLLIGGSALAAAQSEDETQLFDFINAEREREFLPALQWDERLHTIAREHSEDMAQQGQISHSGSDGSDPMDRIHASGVYATRTAENVARDLNVISAHTSLMESIYHRENILDPELTHAGVGIVRAGKYLYVTEDFTRSLDEVSLTEARRILLGRMNGYRVSRGLAPLSLSRSLSGTAQSHIEVQEKLKSLSPPLLLNLVARQHKGALRVNIFTATTLAIPQEVEANLDLDITAVGIGFKRIRGELCEGGCYLITLIFGPPAPAEDRE